MKTKLSAKKGNLVIKIMKKFLNFNMYCNLLVAPSNEHRNILNSTPQK